MFHVKLDGIRAEEEGMADQNTWDFEVGEGGTVKLSGEIDFVVTPKVRTMLLEHVKKSDGPVNLDLSGLNYLDSAGLAVFIELRRVLQEEGRDVQIVQAHPQVKKIFTLTQVGRLFGMEE